MNFEEYCKRGKLVKCTKDLVVEGLNRSETKYEPKFLFIEGQTYRIFNEKNFDIGYNGHSGGITNITENEFKKHFEYID